MNSKPTRWPRTECPARPVRKRYRVGRAPLDVLEALSLSNGFRRAATPHTIDPTARTTDFFTEPLSLPSPAIRLRGRRPGLQAAEIRYDVANFPRLQNPQHRRHN